MSHPEQLWDVVLEPSRGGTRESMQCTMGSPHTALEQHGQTNECITHAALEQHGVLHHSSEGIDQ